MSLEEKLTNVPRYRSSSLLNYAFYGLLGLASVFGCDKSGGSNPTPGNRSTVDAPDTNPDSYRIR